MEDIKYKATITLRLSEANKPVHHLLRDLAEQGGTTTNKYIEDILVKHLYNKGIKWEEPRRR